MLDHRITGVGEPLLLIHGAAEDAELLQDQADALAARGSSVISYNRRGTGPGPRGNWPESGVGGHVGDAADLICGVAHGPVTVLGLSSGGVVALALAAARPDLVRRVIAWEAPVLSVLPGGLEIHAQLVAPLDEYLQAHPGDWPGAYDVLMTVMAGGEIDLDDPRIIRMRRNAEAAVRDDAPIITAHPLRPEPGGPEVVIAIGAGVNPLLAGIADALAAGYDTRVHPVPDAFEHEIYLSAPDVLADLVSALVAAPCGSVAR